MRLQCEQKFQVIACLFLINLCPDLQRGQNVMAGGEIAA